MELPSISKSMGYESKFFDLVPPDPLEGHLQRMHAQQQIVRNNQLLSAAIGAAVQPQQEKQEMSNTRIVRVIIADTNESLPLDKRVLHMTEEKLTDLTDNELFFELPMADLLAKHNEVRTKTKDKTSKDGDMLPAARIRDLRMVVVDIAKL